MSLYIYIYITLLYLIIHSLIWTLEFDYSTRVRKQTAHTLKSRANIRHKVNNDN